MSEENVEIVRSIYEASNRRDWDAAFRDQRPDVEMTISPGIRGGPIQGASRSRGSGRTFGRPLRRYPSSRSGWLTAVTRSWPP